MAREEASPPQGNTFTRFFDRVDRAMRPVFEERQTPADLERPSEAIDQKPCPVCGHPMFEHLIDHSTPNAVLICPTMMFWPAVL